MAKQVAVVHSQGASAEPEMTSSKSARRCEPSSLRLRSTKVGLTGSPPARQTSPGASQARHEACRLQWRRGGRCARSDFHIHPSFGMKALPTSFSWGRPQQQPREPAPEKLGEELHSFRSPRNGVPKQHDATVFQLPRRGRRALRKLWYCQKGARGDPSTETEIPLFPASLTSRATKSRSRWYCTSGVCRRRGMTSQIDQTSFCRTQESMAD